LFKAEEGHAPESFHPILSRSVLTGVQIPSKQEGKHMETPTFESYPWWMVLICNAFGVVIYAIGLFLMAGLGTVWAVLYASYCLWVGWRVVAGSCRSCSYYGKRCAFGKGRLCALIFIKHESKGLSARHISWLDIVPDFLVTLIPLGVGISMLIRRFTWLVSFLVAALAALGSVGIGLVRGQLACKYCKQRELGCPAEQLFSKKKPT